MLNGKAEQVGWLFRKEGIFKTPKRYWVLIYNGVMYIYSDARDKEPREKIILGGAILKKLKDKNKDGKGFMLQIGKKKEKHEFETSDVKAARDWVRALEMEVGARRPTTIAATSKAVSSLTTEMSNHKSVPTVVTKAPNMMADDIIEEDTYDSFDDGDTRDPPPHKECKSRSETSQAVAAEKFPQGRKSFIPLPGSGKREISSTPVHPLPASPAGMSSGHQAQAGQRRDDHPRSPATRLPDERGRLASSGQPRGRGSSVATG